MDEIKSENNEAEIDAFVSLLSNRKRTGREKIVVFAGAAISIHKPSCLPLADPMLRETVKILLQDAVVKTTLQNASIFDNLSNFLFQSISSRIIPPEMFYDAMYEFAGNKVFGALECLKSKHPNINHKILATLLQKGYIDLIITTNFDSLIEQSLSKQPFLMARMGSRIWKIHGDIQKPWTVATTMRRIGQAAFDEKLLNKLQKLLAGSHVLFIGYSGADPDLLPAFMAAKMASVYRCVLSREEKENDKDKLLWKTVEKKAPIKWIVGDLQEALLNPIVKKLNEQLEVGSPTNSLEDHQYLSEKKSPLQENMEKWEQDSVKRLSPVEKVRAILQIIYNIALFSSKTIECKDRLMKDFSIIGENVEAWVLIIQIANAMLRDPAIVGHKDSQTQRDLHAFQAEAYLKLGALLLRLDNAASKHEKIRQEYLNAAEKLYGCSSLKLDRKSPDGEIGQLFIHAKNHLEPIIRCAFNDVVQVQIFLNTSTLLIALAATRNPEDKWRNLEGAERIIQEGLRICNRLQTEPSRKNVLKARCYTNLATVSQEQGNLNKALSRLLGAERLFRKSGDLYGYIITCINIGLLYIQMHKQLRDDSYREKAKDYYNTSTKILEVFPNKSLREAAVELAHDIFLCN